MSLVLLVSFKMVLLWTAISCFTKLMTHTPLGGSHGTLWLLSWSRDTLLGYLVPSFWVKWPSLLTSVAITTMSHQIRSWKNANPHILPAWSYSSMHNFWRKFTESCPPWKIDGWKTILSFLGPVYLQGNLAIRFSEGISSHGTNHISIVRDMLYMYV